MLFIELFLIGISLSIDAFSLALSIGSFNNNINYLKHSIVTGIYHFIMPLTGFIIKESILNYVIIGEKYIFITIITLIILGIIIDKKEITNSLNSSLLFGFTVSLDSFMIGLTLSVKSIILGIIIFSIISSLLTFIGFRLSKYVLNNFDDNAKYISISILVIILIFKLLM